MSTAWLNISAALDTRLALLTGSWPINPENVEYRPTVGTSYLRSTFMPAATTQAELGPHGLDMHEGIFQVSVFTAAASGPGVARDKAAEVAAHFPRGLALASGGYTAVCGRSTVGPTLVEKGWCMVPVSVDWQAHVSAGSEPGDLDLSVTADSFSGVAATLDAALAELTGSWPIAWENVEYRPTVGTSYLRPRLSINPEKSVGIGERGHVGHAGTYTVEVVVPTANGRGAAETKADAVVSHFARGRRLVGDQVTVVCTSANPGPGRIDKGWLTVPVVIAWRAHLEFAVYLTTESLEYLTTEAGEYLKVG